MKIYLEISCLIFNIKVKIKRLIKVMSLFNIPNSFLDFTIFFLYLDLNFLLGFEFLFLELDLDFDFRF